MNQSIEELHLGGDEFRGDMFDALNTLTANIQVEIDSFKNFITSEIVTFREEGREVKRDWSLCKMVATHGGKGRLVHLQDGCYSSGYS